MTNFNATVPDYLRVIRLGYGAGSPGKSACWMTALQAHMNGEWTDRCSCVDPVINSLCIQINDYYAGDNDARTQGIMNFGLFRVLGTNGTEEDSHKRMMHVANVLIRDWFLSWLRKMGVDHRIIIPKFYCKVDVGRFDPVAEVHGYLKKQADPEFMTMLCEFSTSLRAFSTEGEVMHITKHLFDINFIPTAPSYDLTAFRRQEVLEKYYATGPVSLEEAIRRRDKFLNDKAYPLLADLIEMGPHGPAEQDLPVCGINTFHKKVGVQHADHL